MKIYVVFWSNGEETVTDKAFLSERKARAYVDYQNATDELGWHHEELEVEE